MRKPSALLAVLLLVLCAALLPGRAGATTGGADPAGGASVAVASGAGGATTTAAAPKPKAKPKKKKARKKRARPRKPAARPKPRPRPRPARPFLPVAGAFSYGGSGSRFGASRPGHVHQGQDLSAAEGTPVVAPRGGRITVYAEQPSGAGIYLVLRGRDGRDYVFMHLRRGSVRVSRGSSVRGGQTIAEVGNTGASSGAHLHFEIWVGGWQTRGGRPIDPYPELKTWRRR